jgi:hypothetical protein
MFLESGLRGTVVAVSVIGKIPFDSAIVKALQKFKTSVEAKNKKVTSEIKKSG